MSGIETVALAVVAAWTAVLTLVLVLVVRQIAIVVARLDGAGVTTVVDPVAEGAEIGSHVPEFAAREVPELLDANVTHLVLLAASCTPCRRLAAELKGRTLPETQRVVALVPGREELAEGILALLPHGVRTVADPAATDVAHSLGLDQVPSALSFRNGDVVAKSSFLDSANDLMRYIEQSTEPLDRQTQLQT